MRDTSDWPDTVPILSILQTIDQQYNSPWIDGYPVDTIGWAEYSFPNHAHRIEFWKLHFRVFTIFEREQLRLLNLMDIMTGGADNWYKRVRILWNTTMTLLGYTEGQSDRTLRVAEYIKTNTIFQKLDVVVGCRNGIFYPIARYLDGTEITVNRAMTIYKKDFNAEEETNGSKNTSSNQTQDYATRPNYDGSSRSNYDGSSRSNINRSTNTKRQSYPIHKSVRPKPPKFN
jgi:hypothetical protein